MPKSRRERAITLAKTTKKGRARKEALVEEIRQAADTYENVYVFNVLNMRTNKLQQVRSNWRSSRFFIGKNKVMARALGRNPQEEYKPNFHKIAQSIGGSSGLLFTNAANEEVVNFFTDFKEKDFARAGFICTQTIKVDKGPLTRFQHSMLPYLRKLGLPVILFEGVIELEKDYVICQAGTELKAEAAKLLKLFNIQLAEFQFVLKSHWNKDKFTSLISSTETQITDETNVNMNDDDNDDDDSNIIDSKNANNQNDKIELPIKK
eukprot:TRINITY_DN239_c6_g1_i1.p1 TRINITY_DN239_c6_g1~~TRINITY_DN239_c6_g1_i1.p1  ORF type:complete len:264 (-),score=120.58 TRINITY_DN239_c6_g1_i1:25-816(-)